MTVPSHHHDHDDAAIPPPSLQQVGDGAWAYVQLDGSWGLNNTGFVVGQRGVTAIDTCFTEHRSRAFLEAIAGVSSGPVRTLINTHHHGDHTHGNWLLPGATIIGHERCRTEVLAAGHITQSFFQGVDWGQIEIAPPFVTFQDQLTVWSDETEMRLEFMGPAHTTNDVVIHLAEQRLLFAGDLIFNGGTPFVSMGSVAGAITALERIRALEVEVIVPGHGPVCDPGVLDDQLAYLRFVQEVGQSGFDEGLSPLEAALEADLGRFAAWHDPERIVGNLYRAYSELRGEPHGTPIDPAAFADMVTYNGGQPLRCLA